MSLFSISIVIKGGMVQWESIPFSIIALLLSLPPSGSLPKSTRISFGFISLNPVKLPVFASISSTSASHVRIVNSCSCSITSSNFTSSSYTLLPRYDLAAPASLSAEESRGAEDACAKSLLCRPG